MYHRDQNAGKINAFETIKRQEPCQNSDNPVGNIKENSMIDNPEAVVFPYSFFPKFEPECDPFVSFSVL